MHSNIDKPDFIKTIDEIKGAEQEHERVINKARDDADKILIEAKEIANEERMKTSKEVVAFKNESLKSGRKKIEQKVEQMLKKAKEESQEISKKKLDSASISKLVKAFISGL